MTLTTQDCRT